MLFNDARVRVCLLLVAITFLTGCGLGAEGDNGEVTVIESFSVQGSADAVSGVVPINAGINGGKFSVSWKVTASDPYFARLFLSEDAKLIEQDDISVFAESCATQNVLNSCFDTVSLQCVFTADNKVSCGPRSILAEAPDVTTFLDQIPKSANLILHVCNAVLENCKDSAVQIELQ